MKGSNLKLIFIKCYNSKGKPSHVIPFLYASKGIKSEFTKWLVRMGIVRNLLYSKGFITADVGDFCVVFQTCYHCFTMQNFEISPDGQLLALCGRFGKIHLLAANTLEGVGLLKMNSEVSAVAFDNDGSHLFSHGGTVFYLH